MCHSFPAPTGPAESLFKESYYQLMKTALKEDGILCCQGEHLRRLGEAGELGQVCHASDVAASPQASASGCTWTSSRTCSTSAGRSSPW